MKLFCKALAASLCLVAGTSFAADVKKPAKKKAAPVEAPASDAGSSSSDSEAPASKPASQHRAAYGMAGCGLGSLLISSNSKWSQVSAATLNGTGSQNYGISTGTSNCKVTSDDLALAEQEVFVNSNLASLSKDAAQGQGEHLAAFAEILGCGQGDDYSVFSTVTQQNYDQIFTVQESKAVLVNFKAVIKANEKLAKSCIRA